MCAEVTCPDVPISSCSQQLVELQVKKIFCVSGGVPELPLHSRTPRGPRTTTRRRPTAAAAAGGEARPRVNQDVRLNNRVLDLRTPANQAIMRIQSGVCKLFRGFLLGQGFTEIHSPKLVGTASEGGADVFKVEYFDRFAYLAQSPQLYKQMALMGDLERVFEVGPVFRSENSFTHRHMTEFVGLDMEMTFMEHYHEVLNQVYDSDAGTTQCLRNSSPLSPSGSSSRGARQPHVQRRLRRPQRTSTVQARA